tara:strand:+ start:14 stop:1117 length:1104 start_codon:yes stop_codon:yes gene_type:complete
MATFTYESIKNKLKNPNVDGNLHLDDDGAILKIGADSDLQITHDGSNGTITSLGALTIDIATDLTVDVDGGDVVLKDAGTQFGGFSNSSDHLIIKDGTTTMLTGNGANATIAGTLTATTGVVVDNLTIADGGNEIDVASGGLLIDVANNITLDADGGNIEFSDGGTGFANFTNTGGNLIIKSGTTTAMTFTGANVLFAGTVSDSNGNIAAAAYPVGAIFMAVVATNPGTLLGFGTWSAFGAGKTLVGFDGSDSDFDAAEETGGAKTITLSEANLPAHKHFLFANHSMDSNTDSDWARINNSATGNGTNNSASIEYFQSSGSDDFKYRIAFDDANAAPTLHPSSATGSGTAHSNMPPFITVYMWKRTA